MKELETKSKIEIQVKKQKQVQNELLYSIVPHNNHTVFEINNETLDVKKAKYSNVTALDFYGKPKKEIIVKKNHSYVSALNDKNALKKYLKGKNGSKEIIKNPIKLF